MERLIDANKITYQKNNHKGEIGYHFVMKNEIDNAPTVEAIPKDQYEARLKDDLVAMLSEIQLEIEELKNEPACCHHFVRGIRRSSEVIQEKINNLQVNNSKVKEQDDAEL